MAHLQSVLGQRAGGLPTQRAARAGSARCCVPPPGASRRAGQGVETPTAAALAARHSVQLVPAPISHHARPRVCVAAANSAAVSVPSAAAEPGAAVPRQLALGGMSAERVQRLELLVELKKLYRNCIRAEALLALPSPLYVAPEDGAPRQQQQQQQQQAPAPALDSDSYSSFASADSNRGSIDDEEAERVQQAVELVAEMQLTAEQLKLGLRALPAGFGSLFGRDTAAETAIRDAAKTFSGELKQRAGVELPLLPFSSEAQAQAACDVRNSRYNRRLQLAVEELADAASPAGGLSSSSSLPDRLNQAEKVAGKFVARRIRPALQRAREKQLPQLLSESRDYLRGLWSRLNGGGGRSRRALPLGLALPGSSKRDVDQRINALRLELESLEKKLVEASKAREAKLRKAGAAGRVAVAIQLRSMDAEVIAISRLLAVGTLQLEMEYIFAGLEEEALDVSPDELRASPKGPALAREGTTGELALLVAEYGLLLEQLDVLAESISSQMGAGAAGHSSGNSGGGHFGGGSGGAAAAGGLSSPAAKAAGLSLIDEDLLEELAVEIPDLRYRVGVRDAEVFGSNPLSPTRLKLQAQESSLKVLEGFSFLLRGGRLLLSDVGNAGRLFTRAALGGTLKPREVAALRRTARDVLSFIPFVIILIIPLTPLGHVLVFGFIQRYFPGFFPSQFTGQRQDLMMRYDELQRQLIDAQAAAEAEEDEAELARAAAAVARLTAPEGFDGCPVPQSVPGSSPGSLASASLESREGEAEGGSTSGSGSDSAGPAAAKLRRLVEEVQVAREEVHAAPDDDGPGAASMRH